jgi:hypothetical protein
MGESTCVVAHCNKQRRSRGLCNTHYSRWQRGGDPHEISYKEKTYEQRVWEHVDASGDCWEWTGRRPGDYGTVWTGSGYLAAHRAVWMLLVGPIPDGLELDHLCKNTPCVNPDHLEPVSHRVNVRRSENFAGQNARKSRCKNGHEFTLENTYPQSDGRGCRACRADACRRYREKARR